MQSIDLDYFMKFLYQNQFLETLYIENCETNFGPSRSFLRHLLINFASKPHKSLKRLRGKPILRLNSESFWSLYLACQALDFYFLDELEFQFKETSQHFFLNFGKLLVNDQSLKRVVAKNSSKQNTQDEARFQNEYQQKKTTFYLLIDTLISHEKLEILELLNSPTVLLSTMPEIKEDKSF